MKRAPELLQVTNERVNFYNTKKSARTFMGNKRTGLLFQDEKAPELSQVISGRFNFSKTKRALELLREEKNGFFLTR